MRMPDSRPPSSHAVSPASQLKGWTSARQARFLALLAEKGNVRQAAACCGLSAQSAYKLRRREPLFARVWDAALLQARDHCEQIIADRAVDGIEEPVFYRGEQVGVRRRYDTRLLLAHMARLDRRAEAAAASVEWEDADRFDELLAVIAGEPLPDALVNDEDDMPPPREAQAAAAAAAAERACARTLRAVRGRRRQAERQATITAAGDAAWLRAMQIWDGWFARACARVDALEQVPLPAWRLAEGPLLAQPSKRFRTLSTVSTTALTIAAMPPLHRAKTAAAPPRPTQGR